MSIAANLAKITQGLPNTCTLIVVTKNRSLDEIKQVYQAGFTQFGENRVQDLLEKQQALPHDIQWHVIGHLQTNKVKYIAPFVALIHSVDSFKLLQEINKQAVKNQRIIPCLLQVYIAREETKFGLSFDEATEIIKSPLVAGLQNIHIVGLMGMASNTNNQEQIRAEFASLKHYFDSIKAVCTHNIQIQTLSMGMSSDYQVAIAEGSTMVRVGSAVFV